MQIFKIFILNLAAFLQGGSVSICSVVIDQISETDEPGSNSTLIISKLVTNDDIIINKNEASWIASSWMLSHLFSAVIAGYISDTIGRRLSLLFDIFCFFAGFSMMMFGTNFAWLMTGRILMGYPLVSQVYMCEVSPVELRGPYSAIYSTLHALGFTSALIFGAYLNWRIAMIPFIAVSIPAFIGVYYLRESPEWLYKKGRYAEYLEAANSYGLDELAEEKPQKNVEDENSKGELGFSEYMCSCLSNPLEFIKQKKEQCTWFNWALVRKIILLNVLFCLIGYSGFSLLASYAVDVFKQSGSPIDATDASWLTSSIKIPAAMLSFYVIAKAPRKILFFVLGTLICLSFLGAGTYITLDRLEDFHPELMEQLSFIPMLAIVLAYSAYGMGYAAIPQLLVAESMPVPIRSTVTGLVVTQEMLSSFVLSKFKHDLLNLLEISGLFFLFGAVVIAVLVTAALAFRDKDDYGEAVEITSWNERLQGSIKHYRVSTKKRNRRASAASKLSRASSKLNQRGSTGGAPASGTGSTSYGSTEGHFNNGGPVSIMKNPEQEKDDGPRGFQNAKRRVSIVELQEP